MAFYRLDETMAARLEAALDKFDVGARPGLRNSLAITWVHYDEAAPKAGQGRGASWNEEKILYPASVVKLFYAVAVEQWLQSDLIPDNEELRRAVRDMVVDSSNDATGHVVDILTGTTSGPALYGERWELWTQQRRLINGWLQSLAWPELEAVNCCQKTWGDGPYGREKIFYGANNINRNGLSTAATARMLEAVMTGAVVSPPACRRLQNLLRRSLDKQQRCADPENQVDGFLGEGLPEDAQLWSKAGWMSQVRHDAAWFQVSDQKPPTLLVVFTTGPDHAKDSSLLPELARQLNLFNNSEEPSDCINELGT